MIKKFLTLSLIGLICTCLLSFNLQAATFQVTTTEDESTQNGECSLREAVRAAITNSGVPDCGNQTGDSNQLDTIRLPAGTYTLLGAAGEDDNLSGDLDLGGGDIAILGDPDSPTVIDGNNNDRIFEVFAGTTNLTLEDLVLQNGSADTAGGAVESKSLLNLTIRRCQFLNNNSTNGGALRLDAGDSSLFVDSSLFQGNVSSESGGAIKFAGSSGQVDILTTAFKNNRAKKAGGVFFSDGGQNGVYRFERVLFHQNSVVENDPNFSARGGAISLESDDNVLIINSTFSENRVIHEDPNGIAQGGAIFTERDESIILVHNTFINNFSSGEAQALFLRKDSTESPNNTSIILKNNIIVQDNNPAPICVQDDNNGANLFGSIQSLGFNLFTDNSCPQDGATDQVVSFVDLNLGPLQDNGGFTETHALLANSLAIGASDCTDTNGEPVTEDQRGSLRPAENCDVGAFQTGCGDQIVLTPEQCDDGNTENGDGCSADCSQIEEGFICPSEGGSCEPIGGDGCNISFLPSPSNKVEFWLILLCLIPFLIQRMARR